MEAGRRKVPGFFFTGNNKPVENMDK